MPTFSRRCGAPSKMKLYPLRNAVFVGHALAQPYAERARVLVDMTCGNGRDTAFLASHMGNDAVLYAFDIQERALTATRALLAEQGLCRKNIIIKRGSHEILLKEIEETPDLIVFNLGYLPGGNRAIHTDSATTLKDVDLGLHKISANGIIMLTAYPGTPDGAREKDELARFLHTLPQQCFDVSCWQPVNQVHEPAVLFVIQKRG